MNSPELKKLINVWLSEYSRGNRSILQDVYYHVAKRAQEHAVNQLLDELEPLHADAVKSIRSCTSEGATWHRSVADRLEAFVDSHRPDQVTLSLEILATIPCNDEDPKFPTSSELGIIKKVLLSTRNTHA